MNTQLTVPRRRRWKWIRRLVVAVLTLAVLIPAVFFLLERSARSRWERLEADIRAKGQPLTYAEIAAAMPDLADEDNGAVLVAEAIRRLGDITEPDDSGVILLGHECAYDYFEGIDRACLPATRAYLEARRPVLSVLADLPEYDQARLTIPFDMDPMDRISELLKVASPYRHVVKLLYLDAMTHIIDGDMAAAVDRIVLALRTTESLYAEPETIAQLVAIAGDALSTKAIEGLLLSQELASADLRHLQGELMRNMERRQIQPTLLGQRAFSVNMTDPVYLSSLVPNTDATDKPRTRPQPTFDLVNTPRFWQAWWLMENRVHAVAALTRILDAGDTVAELLKAVRAEEDDASQYDPRTWMLRISIPSIERSIELCGRSVGMTRCATVALAAEHFRVEHGQFPDAAAELVPDFLNEIPVDPFDGQPLRYLRTDTGLAIYTIGENEIDDGGDLTPKRGPNKRRGKDFGIRLLDPDKRDLRFVDANEEPSDE